jgi:prophage regulatory protein
METVTAVTNPTRFVRLVEVKRRFGMSTSTIYAKIEKNEFPKQVRIGSNTVAWIESELEAYAQSLIQKARAA